MRFQGSETYVATPDLLAAVDAALTLERPLLVKGEPGTGKTVLAEEVARAIGRPFFAWNVKSTTKAHQGLYEYDAVARLRDSQLGDARVHDVRNYIRRGKLWEAFLVETGAVLLIDEVDKADIEFPNDLLQELDRMEFHVYETGETVRATKRPLVLITSNNEKELPDAFLRRCFFHYIRFPDRETMARIVAVHFPGIEEALLREAMTAFFGLREVEGLKKKPSTSELLDWIKLLVHEGVSPGALAKYEGSLPPLAGALLKSEQDVAHVKHGGFREPPGLMFVEFFLSLRDTGIPVSLREYLTLIEAVRAGVAGFDVEGFYHVARASLVKDERFFDRFDQVFARHFGEIAAGIGVEPKALPEEWLRKMSERLLSPEEKALVKALGGWEKLMEELAKRLREQRERHEGGSKWIGTGGTSPFGAFGFNPEGVRFGPLSAGNRTAVKVWDRREFKDFDGDVEIGTRNMKMALRRLREFVREGSPDELDLEGTIDATARNAGLLDLRLRPERRNRARVLLFLDSGGSMDDHVQVVSQLFSAARTEFSRLETFYFHNCVYESVWRANGERFVETVATDDVLRTYGRNFKLIVVGDASMSPYELMSAGGSVEHMNSEPGIAWLRRLADHFPKAVWLNPIAESRWGWAHTIGVIREVFGGRMHAVTLGGLERAMGDLSGRRRVVPMR